MSIDTVVEEVEETEESEELLVEEVPSTVFAASTRR